MTWSAPAACPDEATVQARVGEFLRASTVNTDSVRARVTVEEGEAGWTADLELTVGELTEHRVLQDRSCDVVATASAFVVAVAVDPQLLTSPEASLNHPGEGESRSVGVAIPFIGEASDPEDGVLGGASMSWTSSEEGVIGTGGTFEWTPTVVGEHTFTLTATDSDGNDATDAVTLTIVP